MFQLFKGKREKRGLNRKSVRRIRNEAGSDRLRKKTMGSQDGSAVHSFDRDVPRRYERIKQLLHETIQFQDINYQLAQQEDKTAIFEEWCGS